MLKSQDSVSLSHKLYRADQVREHEANAALESRVDMYTLMQRAGAAVFKHCQQLIPNSDVFLVLVGQGNNAGDGYIAATHALLAGKNVILCAIEPDRVLNGDAGTAQKGFLDAGGVIKAFDADIVERSEVIIDGLLGTGISGQIRNEFADVIDAINDADAPVVSIDVPSGLDGNTGQSLGRCVQSDYTITLVGVKSGLTTGAGKQACGQLIFEDLGVGKAFRSLARSQATWIDLSMFSGMGPRAIHSHKGDYGRLLCIGGNVGTPGAIRLAAQAAMRTGAGLVKVFSHHSSRVQISAGCPELMVTDESLEQSLDWCSAVVIGPGLGQDEWAQNLFAQTMQHCESSRKPIIMDADALNMLSQSSVAYNLSHCLMTPHAGEAARLLSVSVDEIESDRFNSIRQLAQRYSAICVLKGAGSIVDTQTHAWVCRHGNPGMATAGMGDVLSGVLGALIAQGIEPALACKFGVCIHARAGDKEAELYGERGIMASDLFSHLRLLVNGRER